MPSLSYVYPYPAKGRADLPADDDEVADVAIRGRRSGHTLRIFVDRPESSLPEGDPRPSARAAAEEVVALVRRRTGLGPHPAYP
jgi:hypothetical protein